MTPSYPIGTLRIYPHNGIIIGRFPGRYTRPKTGIFPRSQYELSPLQIFVLRHIGSIAPLRSRSCPISRLPLTFTHGEISQKFFRKFSQVAPHSLPEFAPSRRNPQNPPKPRKTPVYVTSRRNFSKKFFPKKFPKNCTRGACVENAHFCYITKNFSQIFFQIFLEFF